MIVSKLPTEAHFRPSDCLFLFNSSSMGTTLEAMPDAEFLSSLNPALERAEIEVLRQTSGLTIMLNPIFADSVYVHDMQTAFADKAMHPEPLGFGINYTGPLQPGAFGLGRDRNSIHRSEVLQLLPSIFWQFLTAHLPGAELLYASKTGAYTSLVCVCGQQLLACMGSCLPEGAALHQALDLILKAIQDRTYRMVLHPLDGSIQQPLDEQLLIELLWQRWRRSLPASDCSNVLPFKPGSITVAERQEMRLLDTNPVDVEDPLLNVLQHSWQFVNRDALWAGFYEQVCALPEYGDTSPLQCSMVAWPSEEWKTFASVIRSTFDRLLGADAPGESIRFKTFHFVESADRANTKPVICLRKSFHAAVKYFIIDVKLIESEHVHAVLEAQGNVCDALQGGQCVCIEDFITSHIFDELKASKQDALLAKVERSFRRHFFASLGHQGMPPPSSQSIMHAKDKLAHGQTPVDAAGARLPADTAASSRNEPIKQEESAKERQPLIEVMRTASGVVGDVFSAAVQSSEAGINLPAIFETPRVCPDANAIFETPRVCPDVNDIPGLKILVEADQLGFRHLGLFLASAQERQNDPQLEEYSLRVEQSLHSPAYRQQLQLATTILQDLYNTLLPSGPAPLLYDYPYSMQAFNQNRGTLFFNVHVLEVLSDKPVLRLLAELYVTYCHELAHNKEGGHNQLHENVMQILLVRSLDHYSELAAKYSKIYGKATVASVIAQ
eukprot:m.128756 g.128756  ORF g.128756 m.128756 type:complete len:725 (-) comp15839_c0_seq1:113-2287(-)